MIDLEKLKTLEINDGVHYWNGLCQLECKHKGDLYCVKGAVLFCSEPPERGFWWHSWTLFRRDNIKLATNLDQIESLLQRAKITPEKAKKMLIALIEVENGSTKNAG